MADSSEHTTKLSRFHKMHGIWLNENYWLLRVDSTPWNWLNSTGKWIKWWRLEVPKMPAGVWTYALLRLFGDGKQHMVKLLTATGINTGIRNALGWWQMARFFLSAPHKYNCNKLHIRLVRKYICLFSARPPATNRSVSNGARYTGYSPVFKEKCRNLSTMIHGR